MELKGKKVLVCGMAKSGISAAKLLVKLGALVTLQDIKIKEDVKEFEELGIELYMGKNPDDIVKNFDLVVLSPGVPFDLPFVGIAKENNIKVIGDVELCFWFTKCMVYGITGTNGKTTTTALTGEIFKTQFKNVKVLGNIGNPYGDEVLNLEKDDAAVIELSSFQLETIETFKPHISACLNITPDHLNRHKTLEKYVEAKENIFKNQTKDDFCVLNYEDEFCRKMAHKTKAKSIFFSSKNKLEEGIYLEDDSIIISYNGINEKVVSISELNLLGVHNYENVMAATLISYLAGISLDNIRKTLRSFKAVSHRIEFVRTFDGVDYYNDSKGTNTDASVKAVYAMVKPIILIGGGYDKGVEFDDYVKTFEGRVKHLVLIGDTKDKIAKCCDKYNFSNYSFANSFEEAISKCRNIAKEGDCVLLSPSCASWDMFDSYEQRGDIFKEIVNSFN